MMLPSMAPSGREELQQKLLFSNDKIFAKDGEIKMLILVILSVLFLVSVFFCFYLCFRSSRSTADKEDDIVI